MWLVVKIIEIVLLELSQSFVVICGYDYIMRVEDLFKICDTTGRNISRDLTPGHVQTLFKDLHTTTLLRSLSDS